MGVFFWLQCFDELMEEVVTLAYPANFNQPTTDPFLLSTQMWDIKFWTTTMFWCLLLPVTIGESNSLFYLLQRRNHNIKGNLGQCWCRAIINIIFLHMIIFAVFFTCWIVSLLVATVSDSHSSFPNLLPHMFTLKHNDFIIRLLTGLSLRTGMSS